MNTNRELLRIVTVGHVDHGKSTVIGRLLYETKSLPEGVIERVKNVCKENGKPFEYANLLDAFEEEQKQGITIDTTELQFHTQKRDYVIIDAPGHKEFLKNMISGAASAEAALLIIDSNEGIQEQSKRHGYILSLLGIEQVYVIVNKMDLIGYSKEKFEAIKTEMTKFLGELNVKPKKFIPMAAFLGENIKERSENLSWYEGSTLLEGLDEFEKEKGLTEQSLRFPIQDVYKFDHRRIIVGRIESGKLSIGDEIRILPSGKTTKVKTIEYFVEKDATNTVVAGQSVGITVEDEFFNKRGEIITNLQTEAIVSDTVKANIVWMGKRPLIKGRKYKLKLVTQEMECEIEEINKVIDATTLKELTDATEVNTNDVAEITIKTKEKITFDKFAINEKTGRFVLVDVYDVSGGGIVSGYVESKDSLSTVLTDGLEEVSIEAFDDYYLIMPEGYIKQVKKNSAKYKIGDTLPVDGETYSHGDNFDILALKNGVVISVRERKLEGFINLAKYKYSGVDIINTKGDLVKVDNEEIFNILINEYENLNTLNHQFINFANKWFDFSNNRTVKYAEETEEK